MADIQNQPSSNGKKRIPLEEWFINYTKQSFVQLDLLKPGFTKREFDNRLSWLRRSMPKAKIFMYLKGSIS